MKDLWFYKLVFKLSGVFYPPSLSSFLSILSLTVGVATLLVAMALVDSYEKSFKESIHSVFSHVVVSPSYESEPDLEKIKQDLKQVYKRPFQVSEAYRKEGLLAHKGKVSGVFLEGVNKETISDVIDLESKVIEGEFVLDGPEVSKSPRVLIGKSLLKNFDLKVGEAFSVVIPQPDLGGQRGFSRKIFTYRVGGVVDLGNHEYNKRYVVLEKSHAALAGAKPLSFFSDLRVHLENDDDAGFFKKQVYKNFPEDYWVQTWRDKSGGLLEAIKIERRVIFFLVLILVVVAAFNVSTNLYLNLAKRLKEFSVLQTVGMSKKQISKFMILNGFLLATCGIFFGFVFAQGVMLLCNCILQSGLFVPPEVYKLTSIRIELSFAQFVTVGLSTYLLCFVA